MPVKGNQQVSALPLVAFAHMLVVVVTTLVLVWLLHFREGLAFKSHMKAKIFNIHPLLMIVGFILFGGEGVSLCVLSLRRGPLGRNGPPFPFEKWREPILWNILREKNVNDCIQWTVNLHAMLAYKAVPGGKKIQKRIHWTFHLIALLTGILGIYAVFKFHQEQGIRQVYTLHSWVGLITISLYGLQWVYSLFTFAFPHTKSSTREKVAPWHIFGGILIFLLAICTALMGLVENFTFLKMQREQEALVMNFTGLMILLFGITVCTGVLIPRMS